MKGYCKCREVIDEVEYSQFGMCPKCYSKVCKTCFKNEAIEGYGECQGCIEVHRLEKELSELMP